MRDQNDKLHLGYEKIMVLFDFDVVEGWIIQKN